jgi:hypothetical protein
MSHADWVAEKLPCPAKPLAETKIAPCGRGSDIIGLSTFRVLHAANGRRLKPSLRAEAHATTLRLPRLDTLTVAC